jgi:hypothetical protein
MRRFHAFSISVLVFLFTTVGFVPDRAMSGTPADKLAGFRQCIEEFKKMDVNGDGKVTLKEFKSISHPGYNPDELFDSIDTSGNGYITREQYCAATATGMQGQQE